MSNRLEFLEWDTLFFGFRVGRINATKLGREDLNAVLQKAREEKFRCLYFSVVPDDYKTLEAAESGGLRLVDIRMQLEYSFERTSVPPRVFPAGQIDISEPGTEARAALEEIALEIGKSSRFCFDRMFPSDACPRLYRTWIQKLLADPCAKSYVACYGGKPVGLISCSLREGEAGSIELAGVSSQMRGRGIGTALVQEALEWFRSRGAVEVDVVTQGRNLAAQRLYQQMGFCTRHMTLTYHIWLPIA